MRLEQRVDLLERLREYMVSDTDEWREIINRAHRENGWFIPEFIQLSIENITNNYLHPDQIHSLIKHYNIPSELPAEKTVGLVLAGNIPLVGFHDFLSVFLSGHRQMIKPSSKDSVLLNHLANLLYNWDDEVRTLVTFSDMLKGADAYIATGSNTTSRYFDYYFKKYPHIIRRNRTSVAILSGDETPEELSALADDVYQYFGLGCRNVTKINVPEGYDFVPLLDSFNKYHHLADHNKYRNNYDYQLALLIINKQYYMTNGSIILREDPSPFSAISRLNFEYYSDRQKVVEDLAHNPDIQCVVGRDNVPFGNAQRPFITDYADGIDTLQFLLAL